MVAVAKVYEQSQSDKTQAVVSEVLLHKHPCRARPPNRLFELGAPRGCLKFPCDCGSWTAQPAKEIPRNDDPHWQETCKTLTKDTWAAQPATETTRYVTKDTWTALQHRGETEP